MTSIARVSRRLRTLFEHDAVELGKQYGLRQRTMTFTQLAYVLVLGWWKQPAAGPSALARFAGSLGLKLCKQDLDCHWTERTADWRLSLLRRAIAMVVCANAVGLPRFAAIHSGADRRWLLHQFAQHLEARVGWLWRQSDESGQGSQDPSRSQDHRPPGSAQGTIVRPASARRTAA